MNWKWTLAALLGSLPVAARAQDPGTGSGGEPKPVAATVAAPEAPPPPKLQDWEKDVLKQLELLEEAELLEQLDLLDDLPAIRQGGK